MTAASGADARDHDFDHDLLTTAQAADRLVASTDAVRRAIDELRRAPADAGTTPEQRQQALAELSARLEALERRAQLNAVPGAARQDTAAFYGLDG